MIRILFRASLLMLAMSQVACDILSNNTIASNNNTNVGTIGSAAGNNPGVGVPVPVPTSTGTTPAPTPNGFFPVVVNKGMPTVVGTSGAEPEKIEIGVAKIADDQSIQEHAQYVRESLESFGYVPPEKASGPSATVVEPPNGVKFTAAATLPGATPPAVSPPTTARKPASAPMPVVVPPSVPILASGGTKIAR